MQNWYENDGNRWYSLQIIGPLGVASNFMCVGYIIPFLFYSTSSFTKLAAFQTNKCPKSGIFRFISFYIEFENPPHLYIICTCIYIYAGKLFEQVFVWSLKIISIYHSLSLTTVCIHLYWTLYHIIISFAFKCPTAVQIERDYKGFHCSTSSISPYYTHADKHYYLLILISQFIMALAYSESFIVEIIFCVYMSISMEMIRMWAILSLSFIYSVQRMFE